MSSPLDMVDPVLNELRQQRVNTSEDESQLVELERRKCSSSVLARSLKRRERLARSYKDLHGTMSLTSDSIDLNPKTNACLTPSSSLRMQQLWNFSESNQQADETREAIEAATKTSMNDTDSNRTEASESHKQQQSQKQQRNLSLISSNDNMLSSPTLWNASDIRREFRYAITQQAKLELYNMDCFVLAQKKQMQKQNSDENLRLPAKITSASAATSNCSHDKLFLKNHGGGVTSTSCSCNGNVQEKQRRSVSCSCSDITNKEKGDGDMNIHLRQLRIQRYRELNSCNYYNTQKIRNNSNISLHESDKDKDLGKEIDHCEDMDHINGNRVVEIWWKWQCHKKEFTQCNYGDGEVGGSWDE